MKTTLLLGLLVLATACGREKTRDEDDDNQADAVAQPDGPLQLKGTGLLAQSLYNTLGPGKDLSDRTDEEGRRISMFDLYGSNFGMTDGLRFGEIYPDSPSTAYLLSLAIVAQNAARLCSEELYNRQLTLCKCDTQEDAFAMLTRAFPYVDFTAEPNAPLVTEFQDKCSKSYVKAISTMLASLAFALKT